MVAIAGHCVHNAEYALLAHVMPVSPAARRSAIPACSLGIHPLCEWSLARGLRQAWLGPVLVPGAWRAGFRGDLVIL